MRRIDNFESKEAAVEYLKAARGFKTLREAERFLMSHLPKESHYQSQIINYLKENYPDAFVWKAAAGPYCRQGIPDVCAIIGGRFYGFEVKRPYIGVLSKNQEQTAASPLSRFLNRTDANSLNFNRLLIMSL